MYWLKKKLSSILHIGLVPVSWLTDLRMLSLQVIGYEIDAKGTKLPFSSRMDLMETHSICALQIYIAFQITLKTKDNLFLNKSKGHNSDKTIYLNVQPQTIRSK